jgi:XTP/dITP diphosphohydrolase
VTGATLSDEPEDRATGERLLEFLAVMRRLRAECDWKASQTHRSLVRYLLEEAHETAEAIESGDSGHLREELGDLLLQVWFHAVIAEESGEFTLEDVTADIIAKMHRRNPHVFGPADHALFAEVPGPDPRGARSGARLDAATINEVWESIKATEKQRASPVDGIPASLPALLYADKVLDRLAREARRTTGGEAAASGDRTGHLGGQDGAPRGTTPGTSAEIGERLLDVVRDARAAGVDPEQALRDAVRRTLDAT